MIIETAKLGACFGLVVLLLFEKCCSVNIFLPKGKRYCTKFPCLIFHDDFKKLDFSVWEHIISSQLTGNNEFQYYINNRSNSFIKNDVLYLKPTLTNETFGEDFLTSGTLDLSGSTPFSYCTTHSVDSCQIRGEPKRIVNPIQSAAIRTINSFSFKYGKVEVKAKCPRGDWLWPAIWLMPKYNVYGHWPASGEIDLMESRGNNELYEDSTNKTLVGNQRVKQGLHWGPYTRLNAHDKTKTTFDLKKGTFTDDYHTFTLDWNKNGIWFYIDGQSTLNVTINHDTSFWKFGNFTSRNPIVNNPWLQGSSMAPFDEDFYIILNLAVGGTNGYFDDSFIPKKPWKNEPHRSREAMTDFWKARDKWLPTWNHEESSFKIDYVKVWKLSQDED